MSESTNKNLVDELIFAQVLPIINNSKFNNLVKNNVSDKYYKKFTTCTHFVSMMFGIYSRCDSITKMLEDMIGCVGKLNHFGQSYVQPKILLTILLWKN